MKTNKHILTGGPGIGKTTILELMAQRGFAVVPEAARYVIEIEQACDGDALPWKDNTKFQQRVMETQLEFENKIGEGIIFLDRGLIDGHGYCNHFGTTTPEGLIELSAGRYEKVFLLDQLPDYRNDESRLENFEEATRIHEAIASAYISLGYEIIRVPVLSPDERVEFILNRI
jgi:predicted ATPase